MKTIDILNKKCTILSSASGYSYKNGECNYTQVDMTLDQIIKLGYKYREPIDKLRSMEYHSNQQREYKLKFPCWFVGGVFSYKKTEDKDIIEYSNLLAIDIDKKDNKDIDIDNIKEKLFKLPYVIMVSKSISGEGIYVLILVEDGKYTKEYYNYISKLWKQTYNLNIDKQCTNIGRKRFISYDDELLLKDDDCDIKEWKLKLKEIIEVKQEPKPRIDCSKYKNNNKNDNINELTHKAIWYLLNNGYSIDNINCTEYYGVWYHIGCDFRHFDDGEEMFIKFSNNSSKYNDKTSDIIKKWKNTRIETNIEEVNRKWCGICKRIYGLNWTRLINQQKLQL